MCCLWTHQVQKVPNSVNAPLPSKSIKKVIVVESSGVDWRRYKGTFPYLQSSLHENTANPPSLSLGRRFASPKKLHIGRGEKGNEKPIDISFATTSCKKIYPHKSRFIKQHFSTCYTCTLWNSWWIWQGVRGTLCSHCWTSSQEIENRLLKEEPSTRKVYFGIGDIAADDSLVKFYTAFTSYEILLSIFDFLGPSVHQLNYWGSSDNRISHRQRKNSTHSTSSFQPLSSCSWTFEWKISHMQIWHFSRASVQVHYNLDCFLYRHLKEIEWMATVQQVRATLPVAFKQKYPTTYAIIDAVRCSLKRHQTSKCSHQHGAVTSTKYHKVSCYLHPQTFIEGRKQLPSEEVLKGRQIASVRIHVERAIGFIKNNSILKGTLPLTCIYGSTSQPDCLCVCMAH